MRVRVRVRVRVGVRVRVRVRVSTTCKRDTEREDSRALGRRRPPERKEIGREEVDYPTQEQQQRRT